MSTPGPASTNLQALEADVDALLDLAPSARELALQSLDQTDPTRAAAVRRWLGAIDASSGLLEVDRQPKRALDRVGPWQLCGLLGRGGSGEVYLGRRADGAFEREVAIKLLRSDRDADWRITEERRLLARLIHPNIAGLLDGGVAADGRPYLVAERVDGLPLDEWLVREQPALARRIQVYLALGSAVAYAHAHGVVHADLKPGNILVTAGDQPKLLDFGIARLLDRNTPSDGSRMLTPAYAAPELFAGAEATPQTDIYALGLLLYLLLAGQLPEDTDTLSLSELQTLRNQQDAPAPSLRATPLAVSRLRGDLDAIALRCLARDPARRYASVQALLADLDAWQRHRPVQARAGGWSYRGARFVRRHWLALGLGGSAAFALLVGASLAVWQSYQVTQAHRQAQAISQFLAELIVAGDLRTVRDPLLDVPALLRDALARIEARPLSPAADTEILVLLTSALLSHEEFASAAHGLALADARAGQIADLPQAVERARLHAELAMVPLDFAAARLAIQTARGALHGAAEPETLQLIDARLLAREGSFDRAVVILDRLIAARASRDGARHVRTLAARSWKLEALRLNRRPEAVSYGQQLLADVRAQLPANHALLPSVLHHLAFALLDRYEHQPDSTQLDQAQAYLGEALAVGRALYGERSLAVINAHDGLALVMRQRGDGPGHRAELVQLLAAEQALFGMDSVRAALTRFHLGMVRFLDGDQAAGEADILTAAASVESHGALQELATIRQQWALLLAQAGDAERALPASEQAFAALARLESPEPAMRASLHRARARLLLKRSDWTAARHEAEQAIAQSTLLGAADAGDQLRSLKVALQVALAMADRAAILSDWQRFRDHAGAYQDPDYPSLQQAVQAQP